MKNFWKDLRKPFFCLAPMADVTDCAFRKIIANYGKPDVFYTEFVSADGLAYHQPKIPLDAFFQSLGSSLRSATPSKKHTSGILKLLIDLKFSEEERPIVAQIFGGKRDNIKIATELCAKLGFDGIDINMGCPDKSVEKQLAGAACIKNPKLAIEIVKAAREGAPNLPISVKTRIGYNGNKLDEEWIKTLLSLKLPALIVHLRTRKEMSLVPAHFEYMPRIIELRDEISPETLIIGNGDVQNIEDGKKKCEDYGCDGVMLGRAIFGNPWLFGRGKRPDIGNSKRSGLEERLRVMLEHTKLFEEMLGDYKSFAIMKKHYKAYVNGFDGAKELRMKLMDTKHAKEVEKITKKFLETNF